MNNRMKSYVERLTSNIERLTSNFFFRPLSFVFRPNKQPSVHILQLIVVEIQL